MDASTSSPAGLKKKAKRDQWLARKGAAKKDSATTNIDAVSSNAIEATPVASATREQVQRTALLASVTGRQFEDVKFFAFSRRTRDGSVDSPLPLLANSSLIRKASSHFDFVFAAGFAESGVSDMDAPYPSSRSSSVEFYDYSSDSDLEDEEEVNEQSLSEANTGAGEDDMEEALSDSEIKGKGKESTGVVEFKEQNRPIVKPGRVVFLEDIAYTTWKAFIFYAYFDEIQFAPLKSQHKSRHGAVDQDSHKAPLCSPKSMYRVAHKYDIAPLKERAANDIKAKLSPHNILDEIFSTFTSLYSDIQAVEIDYLHSNIKDAGIQARLPTWLEVMEDGRLPKGAAGILASLISKLNTPPAAPSQTGMKRCPNNCSSQYYCQNCGRTF